MEPIDPGIGGRTGQDRADTSPGGLSLWAVHLSSLTLPLGCKGSSELCVPILQKKQWRPSGSLQFSQSHYWMMAACHGSGDTGPEVDCLRSALPLSGFPWHGTHCAQIPCLRSAGCPSEALQVRGPPPGPLLSIRVLLFFARPMYTLGG